MNSGQTKAGAAIIIAAAALGWLGYTAYSLGNRPEPIGDHYKAPTLAKEPVKNPLRTSPASAPAPPARCQRRCAAAPGPA